MICCVAAYCAVDVSLTRRDVEGAVSEASARGVRKVSSRSVRCVRVRLHSALWSFRARVRVVCVLFRPPRRTRAPDRLPTPRARRAPHRQAPGSRGAFDPTSSLSFGVSLEMKLANQAVAEHARAEGEGRARSGLHAE